MSLRDRHSRAPVQRKPDLFSIDDVPAVRHLPPEQLGAYVAALEERCNMLWGYIQGYDCSCDPVVRFLASELGITVAHTADPEAVPAAD